MTKNLKNILIIKPSSLGDIVLALPALSALRRSFPAAEISWLIRPAFAPLLKGHPHLTRTIIFDRKLLGRAWRNLKAFNSLLELIGQLHKSSFDAVIDLQGLFRTACLGWLTGCRRRFGMSNAREFAHIFYTHKIDQTEDCIHLVDYYLKMTRAAGASDTGVEFILPQDAVAGESVAKLLSARGIDAGSYAVFVPGSAHRDKCWPVERFAELADRISPQFGLSVIATGTEPEWSIAEGIKAAAHTPVENVAGLTNLLELVALLRGARLVVSNDTGPGHIAAALGVPVVMMFGRSNPARVAPYRRGNCVAAIEPAGRGFNIDIADPKHDIRAVTIDMVYQKVCEQMKSGASPR